MPDREKVEHVINAFERVIEVFDGRISGPYFEAWMCATKDALALLKAQEARHRLEVHNIGNVDIPECVTWEQFQAVMDGVVAALEHTDKGESWPYDEDGAVKRE